ncbi:hypothetical protein PHLCEN_2v3857 [Hermanssonia centrifuga]|uniref:Uncharacterized protein n=1 Tax=Hermanssonia centrifuga TaxID=98765 RepID=A0A2R6QB59_9APHY|nr:hypothetical protein PHLCEN_2v3857 [Hermanssonia centrifuga]
MPQISGETNRWTPRIRPKFPTPARTGISNTPLRVLWVHFEQPYQNSKTCDPPPTSTLVTAWVKGRRRIALPELITAA